MTFRRAMSLLATGVLVLSALVGGALVIFRLERDRPRMLLERAGVEIGEELDGTLRMVHFPEGAARNEHLLQLGRFDGLRTIVLRGGEVGPDGLRALRSLRQLRVLDLSDCAGTPECQAELERLTTLQELCLKDCAWVTDDGLRHLQALRDLDDLDLSDTSVSDAGISYLLQLPRLERLSLHGCPGVTDKGLQQLAKISLLRSLTCTGATISRPGVRAFLRARPEANLRTTSLDVTDLQPLMDAGAQLFLDGRYEVSSIEWDGSRRNGSVQLLQPGLPARPLDNSPSVVTGSAGPPGSEALALLTDCRAMRSFAVRNVALTDAALVPLAEVSALYWLEIDNCPIRGDGLQHLRAHHDLLSVRIRSPVLTNEALRQLGRMTKLQHLSLERPLESDGATRVSEVSVTDEGLEHLQGLVNLDSLVLIGLPLTGAGLEYLQRIPRLQSLTLQLDTLNQESFGYIARLPYLGRLSLAGPVTADAIRHLSSAPSLLRLELHGTALDAGVARELAALPKLTSLQLVDAHLSSDALRIVAMAPKLESLRLIRTHCRDIDLQEIRRSRPALHVSVEDEP